MGQRDVQRPLLPANVLVCFAKEVCLSPSLLEELDDKLASASLLVCAVYRPNQGHSPLIDEGFEIDIVDGRQGKVEQVAGKRRYGGEVAVEKDSVQYRWQQVSAMVFSGRQDGGEVGVGKQDPSLCKCVEVWIRSRRGG